ncbi:MAG: ACT domain-containing protein [Dehalococcoidia bacterium]|nr:ACT domain-containing protein [Dehalococcoidia bacterium]
MARITPLRPADRSPSDEAIVEARTQRLGRELFRRAERYQPSPAEALGDRAMALLAEDPRFRARLLRFIDALAGLDGDRTGQRVRRLLHEYLDAEFPRVPPWLRALIPILRSELWPAPVVAAVARTAARAVASRFIAAGGAPGALRALAFLRAHGRYPSFDVLGEYVASEQEADAYRDQYLELIRVLGRRGGPHPAVGSRDGVMPPGTQDSGPRTPGGVAALQVSLKLSSLTADFNPVDPAGTLARVRAIMPEIGAQGVTFAADVAKVSIVGLGMRSHAGVAARMFQTLANEGINIQMISTSEIKISVVIDAKYTELAVRVLHDAFIAQTGEAGARS